jgi:hypothetical protein
MKLSQASTLLENEKTNILFDEQHPFEGFAEYVSNNWTGEYDENPDLTTAEGFQTAMQIREQVTNFIEAYTEN